MNWVRDIENEQSKSRPEGQIFEELIRIGYRQFGHQTDIPEMFAALRWWSIASEPTLRAHLEAVYGIDFKRLLRSFLVIFVYFDTDRFRLPPSSVEQAITTEIAVSRLLSKFSSTIADLRTAEPLLIKDELRLPREPP